MSAHDRSCEMPAALADALAGRSMLLCDGAMGSEIHARGFGNIHAIPDLLNITHPEIITGIHRAYVEAGSQLITTNTFNTHRMNLEGSGYSVGEVYRAAADAARAAGAQIVAGGIGPTGKLLEPYGDMSEEDASALFAEQARAADEAGSDLILIETMTHLEEALLAVRACRSVTSLPVCLSMSFMQGGITMMGDTIEDAARALSAAGISAFGANCSIGPAEFPDLMTRARTATDLPLIAQPNAGLPVVRAGKTTYDMDAVTFANQMQRVIEAGATIVGGCCGTTPDFIRALSAVCTKAKL